MTPPTKQAVIDHFKSKGYIGGELFWNYYDAFKWHDKNGKKVLSWKQKCYGARWFDEKNKIPPQATMREIKPETTNWDVEGGKYDLAFMPGKEMYQDFVMRVQEAQRNASQG